MQRLQLLHTSRAGPDVCGHSPASGVVPFRARRFRPVGNDPVKNVCRRNVVTFHRCVTACIRRQRLSPTVHLRPALYAGTHVLERLRIGVLEAERCQRSHGRSRPSAIGMAAPAGVSVESAQSLQLIRSEVLSPERREIRLARRTMIHVDRDRGGDSDLRRSREQFRQEWPHARTGHRFVEPFKLPAQRLDRSIDGGEG